MGNFCSAFMYFISIYLQSMKQFLLFFITLLCFSTSTFGQKNSIEAQIKEHVQTYPQEKSYLVTDRDTYIAGEDMWFAAHLVDAITHVPSTISSILYVDLVNQLDGSVIETRNIKLDDGFGKGDFVTPYNVKTGSYELIAYTNYMRNFSPEFYFRKEIKIISNEDPEEVKQNEKKFQVQFFPEGGYLVNGIENQIALKVVGQDGELKKVAGQIINKEGKSLGNFTTSENGIGLFYFLPNYGEKYTAIIQNGDKEQKFDLPTVLKSGYGMSVVHQIKSLNVTVKQSDDSQSLKGHKILGQMRGRVLFSQVIEQDSDVNFSIPIENFPPGVLHITQFDEQERPRNERLVFIDNEIPDYTFEFKNLEVVAKTLQDEKHKLKILNDQNKEVKGNFSMTILDDKFYEKNQTIQEYLFLESDLPGIVPNLTQYFDTNLSKRQRNALQDQLMRTYGWRRFTWQEVAEKEERITYLPEKDGYVRNFKLTKPSSKKGLVANVEFVVYEPFTAEEARSNRNGLVTFIGLGGIDTIDYYLKANINEGYKKKGKKVKPIYDNIEIKPLTEQIELHEIKWEFSEGSTFTGDNDFVSDILQDPRIGQNYFDVFLDPIVVSARSGTSSFEERFERVNKIYGIPSSRVDTDEFPTNIFFTDMIRTVPGVRVSGDRLNPNILIRGVQSINADNTPLILLDGVPVDVGFVAPLSSFDIDFIDVLKGVDAAVYGSRGTNGVIAVYSNRANINKPSGADSGTFASTLPGYYQAREYYNPMFIEEVDKRAIFSPTLYWNPDVSTTDIEFTSPDYPANYVIKVEGITEDGVPIYYERFYRVE